MYDRHGEEGLKDGVGQHDPFSRYLIRMFGKPTLKQSEIYKHNSLNSVFFYRFHCRVYIVETAVVSFEKFCNDS